MRYVIVNGPPTAGKDTFCEMCISTLRARDYMAEIVSSVALVKDIATKCGWNGEKTPKNRKFLSDLKDLLTEWDDVPTKDVIRRAEQIDLNAKTYQSKDTIIFVMMREPSEIEKFVELTGAQTIIIMRDGTEEQINHADNEIFDYPYDLYIDNNGTLDDLLEAALFTCDDFLGTKGE